jgi:uncharacterized protein (UPF0147 family)
MDAGKSNISKKLAVNISLKDTDVFQKIISTFKEFTDDERIPGEVRKEFRNKIISVMDREKS